MAHVLLFECVDLYRHGLMSLLAGHHVVSAESGTGSDSVEVGVFSTSRPTMPLLGEISLGRDYPLVVVSESAEWRDLLDIMDTVEVAAVVHRRSQANVLHEAIDAALGGRAFVDPRACGLPSKARATYCQEIGATPREEAVADLLMSGMNNVQIGLRLGCSERTAKFHVSNLLRKADVGSRRELIEDLQTIERRLGMLEGGHRRRLSDA